MFIHSIGVVSILFRPPAIEAMMSLKQAEHLISELKYAIAEAKEHESIHPIMVSGMNSVQVMIEINPHLDKKENEDTESKE